MKKVQLLAQFIRQTNAIIILHSGWRFWFDAKMKPLRKEAEKLLEIFTRQELTIAGVTPDLTTEEIKRTKEFSRVKGDEILLWLSLHDDVDSWVVLDDFDLHNAEVREHQVKINNAVGLTLEDIKEAEQILLYRA